MVKIGIAVCGWISENAHIKAFKRLKNVRVESIYDTNIERLFFLKEKFNIPHIYKDYRQFLNSAIDGVVIATPNYTHSSYTNMALASGKHVLCEKPVAISTNEYQNSMKLAVQNNRIFLPAFVNRFRPDIKKLRECILLQEFGQLYKINAEWKRSKGVPRPGSWITHKKFSGGGVLSDLGPHIFDICMFAVTNKEIKKATLKCIESRNGMQSAIWCESDYINKYPIDVESTVAGIVEFMDDVELTFGMSWDSDVPADYTHFDFIYKEGTVSLETLLGFATNSKKQYAHIYVNGKDTRLEYKFPLGPIQAEIAFEQQAEYFIKMILDEKADCLSSVDGLYVTNIIETLYTSNR